MNFTWQGMLFVFVSAVLLVLIPSVLFTRKKKDADKNKDGFITIVEWLDHMELSGVALLSKLVVLFAPVPVAIQTQKHAETYLEIGGIGSWILAFVVEALGYAAAYRLLQFIQYNKNLEAARQAKIVNLKGMEKRQALEKLKIARKKSNAPVTGPAIVYGFYILTVIGFNVLPEVYGNNSEWWEVLMWVFIALLSIPAAYLGAVNAIHTEQKEANKRPRTNAPEQKEANTQPNSRTPNSAEQRRTPNNRTIPLPTNEHPFQIPNTERTRRIEQTARTLEAELKRPPSVREIQQRLRDEDETDSGWSTSTISTALKK